MQDVRVGIGGWAPKITGTDCGAGEDLVPWTAGDQSS